jgi:hypothetical protein
MQEFLRQRFLLTSFLSLLTAVAIAGCGAGGTGTNATSSTCASSGGSFVVVGDAEVEVGKAAGAGILGCSTTVNNPQWVVKSGGLPIPLGAKSQAVGFDIPSIGPYELSVSFLDDSGKLQQGAIRINGVAAKGKSRIVARVDQAVRKGGQLSFHAWEMLAPGDSVKQITWQQIEGPVAQIDTTSPKRLLIKAPDVSQDTLLKFRVTLETSDGLLDSDDVSVVVQNFKQADPADVYSFFRNSHVSAVYPYVSSGPYAASLVPCAYDPNLKAASSASAPGTTCALSRLPFIAQESAGGIPTVEQIMNRVMVSHDWMGEVFERFLRTQDVSGDIRRMLNGVTAIVIGAHIRPAFYYSGTGAIYLDARTLWLTAEQRDTVDETPDPRSGYTDNLQFTVRAWYTVGNSLASLAASLESRVSRSLADLIAPLGSLLYHELTHANDYLPPRMYSQLNRQLSAYDNLTALRNSRVSTLLAAQLPLQSAVLTSVVEVYFRGRTATDLETQYTAQQISSLFAVDRASDFYGYSTQLEDAAMLTEEFMMAYRHSMRRNVAFLDGAPISQTTGTAALVKWGQRGRIAETSIRPRVKLVIGEVLPWINPNTVDVLPAPTQMRPGESILQNYIL